MSFLEQLTGAQSAHAKADLALHHMEEQRALLSRIAMNTEAGILESTYQRIPFVGTADAGGVVRIVLQVPQSIGWDLVSIAGIGTAAGNLALFVGSEDGTGLVTTVPIPAAPFRAAYLFQGEESCPSGAQVTILAEGQTVGQDFRGNLKVNVLPEANARMRQ